MRTFVRTPASPSPPGESHWLTIASHSKRNGINGSGQARGAGGERFECERFSGGGSEPDTGGGWGDGDAASGLPARGRPGGGAGTAEPVPAGAGDARPPRVCG